MQSHPATELLFQNRHEIKGVNLCHLRWPQRVGMNISVLSVILLVICNIHTTWLLMPNLKRLIKETGIYSNAGRETAVLDLLSNYVGFQDDLQLLPQQTTTSMRASSLVHTCTCINPHPFKYIYFIYCTYNFIVCSRLL